MSIGDNPQQQSRWKSSRLRAMSLRAALFARKSHHPIARHVDLGSVGNKGRDHTHEDPLRTDTGPNGEECTPGSPPLTDLKADASAKSSQSYFKWVATRYERARRFVLDIPDIPPTQGGRHIPFELPRKLPLIDERTGKPYTSNLIRSSKYTPWSFLPRQLFVTLSIHFCPRRFH